MKFLFVMIVCLLKISRLKCLKIRPGAIIHSPSAQLTRLFSINGANSGREVRILSTGERAKILERKNLKSGVFFKVETKSGEILKKVKQADLEILSDALTPTATRTSEDPANFHIPSLECAFHSKVQHWIIFSDLHVTKSSVEYCEEVLFEVHRAALERNAGIIFLGDWWHKRVTLDVELLNRILKSLSTWTQPVIMIPGNHDQVTLGGAVHALEPLVYAFRPGQAVLISEPSVFLGALWIPYRRNPSLMRDVLSAGRARQDVSMIYCHADIRGAFMNDGMRSRDGLEVADFPPNIPIYTGHFHKPHTMRQGQASVRYVGSPYQTSLSEAGQVKYLYCMSCIPRGVTTGTAAAAAAESASQQYDASALSGAAAVAASATRESPPQQYEWKEVDRWPIDIGKKYFKATSVEDSVISEARRGDRVVIPVKLGEEFVGDRLMAELTARGVEVELRHQSHRIAGAAARLEADSGGSSSGRPLLVQPGPPQGLLPLSGSTDGLGVSGADGLSEHGGAGTDVGDTGLGDAALSSGAEGSTLALDDASAEDSDPSRLFQMFMRSIDALDSTGAGGARGAAETTRSATKGVSLKDKKELSVATASAVSATADSSEEDQGLAQRRRVRAQVLAEGMNTLSRLLSSADSSTGREKGSVRNLRLEEVSLINFGPYGGDKVTYPLEKRGLVLLTGQSTDGTGADSNGAGKTTLAMSVMWALTGSMDARLTNDGKALDVAYDAGAGAAKRTAEVALRGTINSQSFEIVRRRGARKTELLFSVDGRDLTTQAVKDTQELMDDILGVGNGLMQRCCFFGQHSHTSESLLGLTDVKLKQELSVLVDTQLWATALQDVKSRKSAAKSRLSELVVETRVRGEELQRLVAQLRDSEGLVARVTADLEAARAVADAEMGHSKNALSIQFGNSSLEECIRQQQEVQRRIQDTTAKVLEPLRKAMLDAARDKSSKTQAVDSAMQKLRERTSALRASIQVGRLQLFRTTAQLQSEEAKMRPILELVRLHCRGFLVPFLPAGLVDSSSADRDRDLFRSLTAAISSAISSATANGSSTGSGTGSGTGSSSDRPSAQSTLKAATLDLPSIGVGVALEMEKLKAALASRTEAKQAWDNQLAELAAIDVQIQTATKALQRLKELMEGGAARPSERLNGDNGWATATSSDGGGGLACAEHSADYCPTCGQGLPETMRASREQELKASLQGLSARRAKATLAQDAYKQQWEAAQRVGEAVAAWERQRSRILELQLEASTQNDSGLLQQQQEQEAAEMELVDAAAERDAILAALTQQDKDLAQAMEQAEREVRAMGSADLELRRKIEMMRKVQATLTDAQVKANATVTLLEERLSSALSANQTKTDAVAAFQQVLSTTADEHSALAGTNIVLEGLEDVLGPRGIQHYVFLSVLRQIESIANAYLTVLAEGGIQLSLQGDEDGEKIVKSVLVRSAGGQLRERGLTQLSGGQWRRVSMALDLAFVEVVRRRGTLRSNLIVLDEVLTHLDASGREAVGSVLRALVDGPLPQELADSSSSSSGGDGCSGGGGSSGSNSEQGVIDELDGHREIDGHVYRGGGFDGNATVIASRTTEAVGAGAGAAEDYVEVEADGEVSWVRTRGNRLGGSSRGGLLQPSSTAEEEEKKRLQRDVGRLLVGGGAYETVLVILQDLAAMELEEAFDHVDVVVKEADNAKVIVDGSVEG